MPAMKEVFRKEGFSLAELTGVASALGKALPRAGVVAVHGAMGAGKTTLVRAILQSWGAGNDASSPTFGLVQHHHLTDEQGPWEVRHFDLYRLEDEEEAERSGIAEMLSDPVLSLVEWPERVPGLMPTDAWLLEVMVHEGESRTCILSHLDQE